MLTALVVAETFLLGLVSLVVVALLRTYADVQRRLEEVVRRPGEVGATFSERIPGRPEPVSVAEPIGTEAPMLVGETLAGDSISLDLIAGGPNTLLAFLSSGCMTCRTFWRAFADDEGSIPADARLVVITKDLTHESPSKLTELAPPHVAVIHSSATWEAYEVPGAPYFVYVDGASGRIHGQGAAEQWDQIKSLLKDAILDSELAAVKREGRRRPADASHDAVGVLGPAAARALRAERALAEAGITPDDPSLWTTTARDRESFEP